jgi:hypothetical protein
MKKRLVIVFAAAVGLTMSVPLVAHHTGSTLYAEKTITLKAVVKTWLWSNPHCLLTFDVKGEDGQVVQWLAEAQAPNTAYTEGYRPKIFNAGDEVTITVRPAMNGRPFGLLAQVVLADGTTVGNLRGNRAGGRGAAAQ